MTTWNEYVSERGTVPEWPYPIRYEKESLISCDVLIVGGGVAGCHAAISAARKRGERGPRRDGPRKTKRIGRRRCRSLARGLHQPVLKGDAPRLHPGDHGMHPRVLQWDSPLHNLFRRLGHPSRVSKRWGSRSGT